MCEAEKVTGNKITRSEPYQAAIENELVYLLLGPWNKEFTDEHEKAPNGARKDQWDSAGGAFNKLTVKKKKAGKEL